MPDALAKSKSVFQSTLWIAIIGFALLLLSQVPTPVASSTTYSALHFFSGTQTTFYFQKTGDYYINDTSGEAFLTYSSRIEVYNDKEQMIFSLPLTYFPSSFEIDSKGYCVIVLENVTLSGAVFSILEAHQLYTITKPESNFALVAGSFLILGLVGVGCVLAIRAIQMPQETRDRLKVLNWKFPKEVRLTLGFMSTLMISALVFAATSSLTGSLLPWSDAAVVAAFLAVVVYWLKLREVVDAFVSIFGTDGILVLRRMPIILVTITYSSLAGFFIASLVIPSPYNLVVGYLLVWTLMPFGALLILFFPFYFASLDNNITAFFSLNKFLLTYRQCPNDANFGLIRHASRSIADLLRTYNYRISSTELAEQISLDLLDENVAKENCLIDRLLGTLNPINAEALITVIRPFAKIVETPNRRQFEIYVVLLGAIATIVGAVVSLLITLIGR